MRVLSTYLIGLIFGIGISISGMANPAKVLNFFDFAGTWDPSLAFVMGGAVIVAFFGYRVVLGRPAPMMEHKFHLPTNTKIDAKLVGGSLVFGIGWGIAGFCPGGALPALGTGRIEVFIFTGALLAGIFAAKGLGAMMVNRAKTTAN
ncbi:MAG: YeeE/YedE family protein [Octadecabacter sp.]|tara:strand:+ start:123 stop:563 length:441 start_codon:yes stop_codon:yes gene_type:complete